MPFTAPRPTLSGALAPALALLLGLAPHGAQALGLGRPQVHSALGGPLDVSVPLSLAEGEQLTESCVRAEVSAGDARVPAGLLQLRIEGERGQQRIRLQSLARIEEPALRITLALGCPLQLTREFNAFVDPPGTPAPLATAAAPPLPVYAPVAEPSPAAVEAKPAPAPRAARPRARPQRAPAPRLVLERPEVLVSEAARPAQTASAAEVTPELEAQITQLEQTVAELRADLEARLQAQAAAASAAARRAPPPAAPAVAAVPVERPAAYRDPMTWLLTLGISLIAGAAAFHFGRWRDERARRELAYWRALHAAEGAGLPPAAVMPPAPGMAPPVSGPAVPLPEESQHQITRPQPRPLMRPPAVPVVLPPETPTSMQATQPLPPQALAAPELALQLTVADELLDLQQQVEFLQLLGQQEAAADLLATRLASGDGGAMPALMLMEICQQRGEPDVFAELSRQFEQRFSAPAPSWAQSVSSGRGLDACTSVIAHLQVVWSDPASAMQMLQDLLARGGGPGVQHFELPAYRDLLTLYSVARDLFEAGLRNDEVDLMLPIDSGFGREA
jgi:hypothetical protein